MKIVFITPSFSPFIGGVEKHVSAVAHQLSQTGDEVMVLTPRRGRLAKRERAAKNLEIIRYTSWSRMFVNWLSLVPHLSILRRAEIIHAHDFVAALTIYPFVKMLRKPFFVTFHGWEGKVPPSKRIAAIRRWLERRSDGSIIVGEFIRRWYKQIRNIVVYGGVHESEIVPALSPLLDIQRFLFVGRLEPDTGIHEYVHLFDLLHQHDPHFQFTVTGEGSLRLELEEYCAKRGVPCRFVGRQADTASYMLQHEVICTSGYLGILESLARRKLVVALYDNSLKEDYLRLSPFARHILVAPDASRALAALIDQRQQATLRKAAAAFDFSRFTWTHVTNVYRQLWRDDHVG